MKVNGKWYLLIGMMVVGLIIGGTLVWAQETEDHVYNEDTEEYFDTIQTAIDDEYTDAGDTILVETCYLPTCGPLVEVHKNVEIVSASGSSPRIDSSPMGVFIPTEGSNSSLSGFTIEPIEPDSDFGFSFFDPGISGDLVAPQGIAGVTLVGISYESLEEGQLDDLFSDPVKNVEIYSNEIANNLLGVGLLHASNNQIGFPAEENGGNYIHDNAIGIGLLGVNQVTWTEELTKNLPFDLPTSLPTEGNYIEGNTIFGNYIGVGLLGASNNFVKNNNSTGFILERLHSPGNLTSSTIRRYPIFHPYFGIDYLPGIPSFLSGGITGNKLAGVGVIGIEKLDIYDSNSTENDLILSAKLPATGNEISNNNISFNRLFGVGLMGASNTSIEDHNSVNLAPIETVISEISSHRTNGSHQNLLAPGDMEDYPPILLPTSFSNITGNGLAGVGIIGIEDLELSVGDYFHLSAELPATGNKITNNNISNNRLFGVGLMGASNTLIEDNNSLNVNILESEPLIPASRNSNRVFRSAGITGNGLAGVGIIGIDKFELTLGQELYILAKLPATGNEIINNQITHNELFGVGMLGASDTLIEGNEISDNLIGVGVVGMKDGPGLPAPAPFFPIFSGLSPIGGAEFLGPTAIHGTRLWKNFGAIIDISISSQNNTIKNNTFSDSELLGIGIINSDDTTVKSNTIENSEPPVNSIEQAESRPLVPGIYPPELPKIGVALFNSNNTAISKNIIKDNDVGLLVLPDSIDQNTKVFNYSGTNFAHYNEITGNDVGIHMLKPYPLEEPTAQGVFDATLNYWGHSDGPTVDWYDGNGINYPGGGDSILGPVDSVSFSPWIIGPDSDSDVPGLQIDTDPDLPGVQLPDSLQFMVDDVGPQPEGGYLKIALEASKQFPGEETAIYIRSDQGDDDYKSVTGEEIIVPEIIVLTGGSNVTFNNNSIFTLVTHYGTEIANFSINYWGSPPNVEGNKEDVLLSPWLLEEPGTENMRYKVASMGADPEGGLTRAIADANDDRFEDEIIVDEGTYNVSGSTGVTEPTDIVSCTGCPTTATINGELLIETSKVNVGGWENETYDPPGFNINADVTVTGDVDASTVHINWNNIYGTVTNDATGTLDATYNWWGGNNPDDSTTGDVDVTPFLPDTVCSVLEYMDDNEIEDPKNAVAAMICGGGSSSEQAVCELTGMGFDVNGASNLLNQYGLGRVVNAMENSTSSSQFVELLGGYSLPAGAAGGLTNNTVAGGAGSIGGRTVGAVFTKCETIEINFPLADFQGNPSRNLTPTVSLVKLDKEGNKKGLEKVTTATYSEDEAAYVASISSCELSPGYYLVQIDLPDLSALTQVIQVKGEEA